MGYGRCPRRLLADKALELALVEKISQKTVGQVLKKTNCSPTAISTGVWGGVNAVFVVRMEDVLAVYERPDDPRFPVVCFDERHCVLHGQPVEPLPLVAAQPARGEQPAQPGRPRRESSTYVRQDTACLLAVFEPGTGQRLVEVSAWRTGADYCRFLQLLAAAPAGRENRARAGQSQHPHRCRFLTVLACPRSPRPGRALRGALHTQKRLLS